MKVDWTQDVKYLEWANQALSVQFNPAEVTWLASIDDDGSILGVVVYSRFSRQNCEMSVAAASPKFLSRKALRAFFGYPFWQLNCRRVTAVIETTNIHCFEFNERLGFKVEGLLRGWYDGADGILSGLLKEECKWL